MISISTDEIRVGYFKYQQVTMKDFMTAILEKFLSEKSYPLVLNPPSWPVFPEPWHSSSDSRWDTDPSTVTYNRFFQEIFHFLEAHELLNEVNLLFGVSCSLYVAANATGLKQGSFIGSAAWQCIGFETGAASGAQLGNGKRSLAFAGDGGFMMVCQSLSTLARNKLNAVIFVMSNGVYAIEQVYVDINAFNPGAEHRFDNFDILPKWDYLSLAKAFGAEGIRVQTINELREVLLRIKDISNCPTLIEVVIPEKDLPSQMKRLGT
jgi:indolepyruvate decarboxylase